MANQDDESNDDLDSYFLERNGSYSFLLKFCIVVGVFSFFAVCICLLQYANRRYNRRQHEHQLRSVNDQLATMQASITKQDQTRLQEERKRKYLCFLRPSYTMVVTESDFTTEDDNTSSLVEMDGTTEEAACCKQNDKDCDLELGQLLEGTKKEECMRRPFECHQRVVGFCQDEDKEPATAHQQEGNSNIMKDLPMALKQNAVVFSAETDETTSISNDSDEYQHDLELGHDEEGEFVVTLHHATSTRFLWLPVTDESGNPRKVHAECSICIMEYEVGDEVVWSTRRLCPHAFHSDCILLWLSKGKKRCPNCRHFFVPGQRVDDKEVIVQDESDGIPPPTRRGANH